MTSLAASREISVPFHIGPDGGIAVVTTPYDAAVQHICTVISTMVGERLMRPAFGSEALAMLFEPNDDVVSAEMAIRLAAALAQWEPGVRIVNVRAVPSDPSEGQMNIEVQFTLAPRTEINTAEVAVGGAVGDEQGF